MAPKEKNTAKLIKDWIRRIYYLLTMLLAYFTADAVWFLNVGVHWKPGFDGTKTLILVGLMYCIVYAFFSKMYNAHKIGRYRLPELTFSQMLAFFIADVCLFVASFFWFHNFHKIKVEIYFAMFLLQLLIVVILTFIANRVYSKFDGARRVIIVYGKPDYDKIIKKLQSVKYRYNILGVYPQDEDFKTLFSKIDDSDDVFLYDVDESIRLRLINYCISKKHDIHMSVTIEDMLVHGFEISHTLDTPFYRNKKNEVMWYYPFVKRLIDIVASFCGLLVLSPVLIIVAIMIKAYDGGPVFYRQVRMTKGGRTFKIIKFRSMVVDAEQAGAQLATVDDDRITPIGKFIRKTRIDELPQLINILVGDMAIVGPRPERPEIAEQYLKELPEFNLRLQIKAGLTGYAQVYGKYNTSPEDKLKLDLLYIAQRSLLFDFKILFYTLKIICKAESTEGVEK